MNSARKVRICAGENAQPHPERDAMVLAIGRAASRAAERGIPFARKLQLCAGDPDNDGTAPMVKALASVESMLLDADKPKPSGPTNRPRATATLAAGRPERVRPTVATPTPAPGPAASPAPACARRIGDHVQFQHGRVRGEGRIVGSGRAGVTVQDRNGNHHQVRHEHVLPPAPKPAFIGPSESERLGGRHAAEGLAFYDFRDRIVGDIRKKRVSATPDALIAHAIAHYGLRRADAAEWTERFMASVGRDLERRAA